MRKGILLRNKIRYFCSTYGSGWIFPIRRKIVVFLSDLLDLHNQDLFENTEHRKALEEYKNKFPDGKNYQ